MECNCRDLVRHFRFQQERYSPGYYVLVFVTAFFSIRTDLREIRLPLAGRYRADFYHRLSVYPLMVPALRDRRHDVLLLAGNFHEQNRSRLGLGSLRLSKDGRGALLSHGWAGNVRELEHSSGRSAQKALAAARSAGQAALSARPRIVTISARPLDLPLAHETLPVPDGEAAEAGRRARPNAWHSAEGCVPEATSILPFPST